MSTKHLGGLAIAGAALALLAACSSKSNSTGSSNATAMTPSSSAASGSASSAAVKTTRGSLGTFLTDSSGRTLYLWMADKSDQPTCYNSCAQFWPPLLTKSAPTAGSGVDAGKLGISKRTDGTTQVTYNGHPLYYFAEDRAAGDTTGEGNNGFGALWWVVGPNGAAITGSNGASSSSSSGYNY